MSDTKKKDVGSELPDEDALAAFANSALGSGRRRRRPAPTEETPADTATSTGTTSGPAPDSQVPEEQGSSKTPTEQAATPPPATTEPKPETAPKAAAEEPKPTVPSPTLAPEQPATPTPTQQDPAPTAAETPSAEVEVRAVTVPVTRTTLPPGLQGGTVEVRVPTLGPTGARATQCTVMVSTGVRDRFTHYQLTKKMAGEKEPSNALVVRRAFLHAKRNNLFGKLLADVYHQQNQVDDEDYDEDGLLGDVVGRRTVRGRMKQTGQQSFRPSEQELATYDAYSQAYGFPSRSDFLDAVLDEFLPQLPTSGRRR